MITTKFLGAAAAVLLLGSTALVGCEREAEEGVGEVEQVGQRTGDTLGEGAGQVERNVESLGQDLEQGVGEVGEGAQRLGEETEQEAEGLGGE